MKNYCLKIFVVVLMVIVADVKSFAAARKVEVTSANNVIIADWSKKAWSVGGKKSSAPTGVVDAQTPDGKTAITFKTQSKGKGVFRSGLLVPGAKWRNKKYNSMSFWVKNNGSPKMLIFRFYLKNGKTAKILLRLPVGHEWVRKNLSLNAMSSVTANIKFLTIRTFEKVDFSIGPIQLNVGTTSLQLEKCNQAVAASTAKAPVIDGVMNEAVWQKAKHYSLEKRMRSAKAPIEKTKFKLLYDKENIYVGATLICKDFSKLKAVQKENSSSLFSDDCFEFFIDSNNDLNTSCQFVINSKGARTAVRRIYHKVKDQFSWDKNWRPNWRGACQLRGDKWTLELAIPLEEVGIKFNPEGQIAFIQVGRENHVLREYSTFSPTSKFPVIKHFGDMIFELPGSNDDLKIFEPKLSKTAKGKFVFSAAVKGIKKGQSFKANLTLVNETGYKLQKNIDAAGNGSLNCFAVPFEYLRECEGSHRLVLNISAGKKSLYQAYNFILTLPITSKFGDIILNPMPKKIRWGKDYLTLSSKDKIYIATNASKRTEKTAKMLSDDLFKFSGKRLQLIRSSEQAKNKTGIFMTVSGKGHKEGYELAVNKNNIELTGNDEPGLYYAGISLMQVLRGSMRITSKPEIRRVNITDWPDLSMRLFCESNNWKKYNPKDMGAANNYKWYQEFFKRNVAGQKYNMYTFDTIYDYYFAKHPKVRPLKNNETLRNKKFLDAMYKICQDHFIEFIPKVRGGGHFWISKANYPQFYEKGFKRQGDSTVPGYYDLIFGLMNEVIDGKKINYLNIMQDEWWAHAGPEISEQYKGIPRKIIFKNDTEKQRAYLNKKGIKTMMCADMILRSHNGNDDGPRKDLYTIADKLPKDIIMLNWSLKADPDSNRTLYEKGFPVISCNNGFDACPGDRNNLAGFGWYSYGHSHLASGFINDSFSRQYGYSTLMRCADYAWNIKRDPGTALREFERNRMSCVGPMNAVKNNPAGSAQLTPISIASGASATLSKIIKTTVPGLKSGRFGFIPMDIIKDRVIALKKDSTKITVNIDKKLSGFYFLQGLSMNAKERKQVFALWKHYLRGAPVAEYRINYTDGTNAVTKARFGLNTIGVMTPEPRSRFMSDVRYIWEGKTTNQKNFYLFVYEWINPYPNKKIKSITLSNSGTPGISLVFAITGRGIK
jgi:Glycosyl hydrolase family 20, domain 2/Carbohydrate family 9 binding domain-like